MRVSVIGLGYIGLPTAAILADSGVSVLGVDNNQSVVDTINQGLVHIKEPQLDALVDKVVKNGSLRAVTEPQEADAFVIAVPTPFKDNHKPDLSYIKASVKSLAPLLKRKNIVVLESTSPVGTTEKIMNWMKDIRPDLNFPVFGETDSSADISIAYCPERVLPGNAIYEMVKNDRIIGGITANCSNNVIDLYKTFIEADCLITDCRTAELSKLVENAFRDVNIAFANELSIICDHLDINVWELIKLANHHPRVDILQPGPGVGGHCIAVDPWFIVNSAPSRARLIKVARLVNDEKPKFVIEKINQAIKINKKKKKDLNIACLGLAFKPDIDDLRESPALEIAKKISLMGFSKIFLVEPNINQIPSCFKSENTMMRNLDSALFEADIIVLLVDHSEFKSMDLGLLSGKQVIDTRGTWTL
jgi:UDP-N-acetyl-D-mannosaminuronic acid dehydrogenase